MENQALFTSFAYINYIYSIRSNLQTAFHQDNLSLVCLQCYKHICLNILACNIYFCIQEHKQ